LRDRGPTEIGGFGIASTGDPLLITDIQLVRQQCTVVTVAFDDAAVADFFDEMIDHGLKPARFARVWIHTHPGESALPSATDEETFARVFGGADFAAMAIVACGGETFARLQFGVVPGASLRIPVEVDFADPFEGSDFPAWEQEYERCVQAIEEKWDLKDVDPAKEVAEWKEAWGPEDDLTLSQSREHWFYGD
jgi:hypothetical protein